MMMASGRVLAFDDAAAIEAIRSNLKRWAKADALDRFDDPPTARMYYNLNRTLLPAIVAYALIRDHPDVADVDRMEIERWLAELVWRRGPQRVFKDDNISSRNNHRYVSAAVTMAWGGLIGADPLFRDGVSAYMLALEDMSPDGSLPLEMERGRRALHYQRHAITSLVTIAELAAVQGFDLYAYRGSKGTSLHLAIDFLARALHDPRVLAERFEANGLGKPPKQDLGFLVQRGHDRQYMAWLEPYRARFGHKDSVTLLEASMAAFGEPDRPLADDHSGANTTCLFAVPDPGDPWEQRR
jgi:poly(beta-D-mannuronate) lyase